jgi:hypothetical protein
MRKNDGHKILWRGTEQGEWLKFLANDEKVTVWNHESIDTINVKKSTRNNVERIDPETIPNLEVREFSDPSVVVNDSDKDVINVVNIPGVFAR